MLFSKNIEKRCAYCAHAKKYTEDENLCKRHGPVPLGYSCHAFKYDPLKRVPPKKLREDELPLYEE